MKIINILVLTVSMVIATDAYAQSIQDANNQSANDKSSNSLRNMDNSNYNRLYVSYNPMNVLHREPQSNDDDANLYKQSIAIGYLHANNIIKNFPIYVEYGGNIVYTFGKQSTSANINLSSLETEIPCKTQAHMFSVNIPINLALRVELNKIKITPYVGFYLQANFIKYILKEFGTSVNNKYTSLYADISGKFYSKGEDFTASGYMEFNRLQVGANLGVGITWNKFYVGIGHVIDFSKINKLEYKYWAGILGINSFTIGITF